MKFYVVVDQLLDKSIANMRQKIIKCMFLGAEHLPYRVKWTLDLNIGTLKGRKASPSGLLISQGAGQFDISVTNVSADALCIFGKVEY